MFNQKFLFVAADDAEERRSRYLMMLEKAKSIYFASQNQLVPSLLVFGVTPPPLRVFDIVTKESFNNEQTLFTPSSLWGKGIAPWIKGVVKFFYDNKGERFNLDLVTLYFGKFCSFSFDWTN